MTIAHEPGRQLRLTDPPAADGPRYRVLGPLEVWQGERLLDVGGPQQRALLAVLLLNANRVVATDRLIEYLWGPHAPQTARTLLQGCISQLRRVLPSAEASAGEQPLVTRAPGYVLNVAADELDLLRFERLAKAAADVADAERRARLLAAAVGYWSGPVLDGQDLPGCSDEIAELEERRSAALEERIAIDLSLCAHAGLVVELKAEVRSHPLRERLWALLIAALYGLDRQAEALATFLELRDSLVDQLGIEPSSTLRELHRQVLAGTHPGDLVVPVANDRDLRRTG
ncbi:AfsR/SARP family transcriptional regulator [Kribbella catacumbae]|uniref:AfsR/SARP family transcriptional regulator n=1 Tax=Kribbella catacumbae TaxID=460086 RepID=UPI000379A465|nr:AfsR/SARP family transcriptional regulator [Kribbella catacumbae]